MIFKQTLQAFILFESPNFFFTCYLCGCLQSKHYLACSISIKIIFQFIYFEYGLFQTLLPWILNWSICFPHFQIDVVMYSSPLSMYFHCSQSDPNQTTFNHFLKKSATKLCISLGKGEFAFSCAFHSPQLQVLVPFYQCWD